MKPTVYIETTIPSFYHEVRTEPVMAARREWTRRWWDSAQSTHCLVSSVAVVDELSSGEFPGQGKALKMMAEIELLTVNDAIMEIVQAYLAHQLMPADPTGDALHLAIASYHRCNFLVTWNCQHLANANKYGHIQRVNNMLGIHVPALVTLLELLGEDPSR
jgi:hypothetical protein